MKSVILFDIASHLAISFIITIVLWPYVGIPSLIIILFAICYLVYSWAHADFIVARKAGFRQPTLVQKRYLENLYTGREFLTYPSLLALAGTLASRKHRLILLSSGVFELYEQKVLTEDGLKELIEKLSSRDSREVFSWTFHLATGGARLFRGADKDDPTAGYWRKIITMGILGGAFLVMIAVVIAAPLSAIYGHPLDISPIVPVLWLPFVYLTARFIWRRINAMLIKPTTGSWNKQIIIKNVIFSKVSNQVGNQPNLNLLRHGLLIADKRGCLNAPKAAACNHR